MPHDSQKEGIPNLCKYALIFLALAYGLASHLSPSPILPVPLFPARVSPPFTYVLGCGVLQLDASELHGRVASPNTI